MVCSYLRFLRGEVRGFPNLFCDFACVLARSRVSEFSYFTKSPDRYDNARHHDKEAMAQYKYFHYLTNLCDAKFDQAYPPGAVAPHSGIYKCHGCGSEVLSNAGDPLPPQSHHQHSLVQGGIGWRLIVATG